MLGKLARQHDPNVLVGFDKADDAGVYKISDQLALVQTVDFFTPIVDDPYTFGQIAAVNALSDVYAMGGRPLSALAMVCFPEKGDLAILERILAGGLSKMMEANCTVIGGHSIRDEEMKFGYAVTGTIEPRRVLANSGARAGDFARLLLDAPRGHAGEPGTRCAPGAGGGQGSGRARLCDLSAHARGRRVQHAVAIPALGTEAGGNLSGKRGHCCAVRPRQRAHTDDHQRVLRLSGFKFEELLFPAADEVPGQEAETT